MITQVSPTKIVFPVGVENMPGWEELLKAMEYEDKRVTYQYLQWRKIQKQDDQWLANPGNRRRHWFFNKNTREDLDAKVAQLNRDRFGSCLGKENGQYWTYSGLANLVSKSLGLSVQKRPVDIKWQTVAWAKQPPEMRWYQKAAVESLCPEEGFDWLPRSVAIGTGLGKSLIMGNLVRRVGCPTVVVVPTLSIANQMLENFTNWFGRGKVGQFFGGKKQSDKMFLIAVSKSLGNVEKGDKHWDKIANRGMVLVDECHLTPPESLSSVMFSLLSNVPYRFFFSGTCFRNDGLDLLLRAIVGETVFEMSVGQGIKEGFLSPLKFYQWKVRSDCNLFPDDPIKFNKIHLHQNKNVYRHAANLINRAVGERNRRVLVFVDTVDQYQYLLDGGLKVPSKFAHGPLSKDNRDTVPKDQWKFDPTDLVKQFDNGDFPVLVGTSCIGIGTDVCSADFIVNIVGLTSEIDISQNAGRGTRLFPGKTECIYNDYWVYNLPKTDKTGKLSKMDKHALERRRIFDSIYGQCGIMEDRCK